jgi:hypothetical protein
MEITEEEFIELMNEFKDDYDYYVEGSASGLERDPYQWLVVQDNNGYYCYKKAKKFVKNELRQSKLLAKVDEKLCDAAKIYKLNEPYNESERIMARKNRYGLFNVYIEEGCGDEKTFVTDEVIQADSCKEVVESLGYVVKNGGKNE